RDRNVTGVQTCALPICACPSESACLPTAPATPRPGAPAGPGERLVLLPLGVRGHLRLDLAADVVHVELAGLLQHVLDGGRGQGRSEERRVGKAGVRGGG